MRPANPPVVLLVSAPAVQIAVRSLDDASTTWLQKTTSAVVLSSDTEVDETSSGANVGVWLAPAAASPAVNVATLHTLVDAESTFARPLLVVIDDLQTETLWLCDQSNHDGPAQTCGIWFLSVADIDSASEPSLLIARHLRQLDRAYRRVAGSEHLLARRVALAAAHDINNLVTIVGGNVSLLAEHVAAGSGEHEMLVEADLACQRAQHFARTLQSLAPGVDGTPAELLDVKAELQCAAKFASTLLPGDIKLAVGPAEGQIVAARKTLQTALWNLIANARDALTHGGQIDLYTDHVTLDTSAAAALSLSSGKYVVLGCRDNGPGLAQSVPPQTVFNPFVSQSRRGQRVGLGLTQVASFAHSAGGAVTPGSPGSEGGGFDVQIYLPCVAAGTTAGMLLSE
jgi:signal transduction histidine kinase